MIVRRRTGLCWSPARTKVAKRACGERPYRAAEQRDEFAAGNCIPLHSITSSARASSIGGISRASLEEAARA
jgi:hypothetical protein